MNKKGFAAILIIAVLVIVGSQIYKNYLSRQLPTESINPVSENTFQIYSNTQITYDDLKVGAGNFRKENFVTAAGETKNDITAGLWIFHRTDNRLNKTIQVHTTEELIVGNYKLNVLKIATDEKGSFVVVEIIKL